MSPGVGARVGEGCSYAVLAVPCPGFAVREAAVNRKKRKYLSLLTVRAKNRGWSIEPGSILQNGGKGFLSGAHPSLPPLVLVGRGPEDAQDLEPAHFRPEQGNLKVTFHSLEPNGSGSSLS